jgi:WD40 repeat protein
MKVLEALRERGGLAAAEMSADEVHLKALALLKYHDKSIHGVCFSPSGNLLATTGSDGKLAIWQLY